MLFLYYTRNTPLRQPKKRFFLHFPAFPRIASRRPAFREKTTFFANAKVPPRVFEILPPSDLPLPSPASFSLSAPLTAGREKMRRRARTALPRRRRGRAGEKKKKTESGSDTKWEGRGQKSAARAVRRKAMRVGKRKKRRETAEAPPKPLGAPLPKKARCRRQEADRKKRYKGQVLQKILAANQAFCEQNLTAGKVLFGE